MRIVRRGHVVAEGWWAPYAVFASNGASLESAVLERAEGDTPSNSVLTELQSVARGSAGELARIRVLGYNCRVARKGNAPAFRSPHRPEA